jgi:uncharacterized protein (TIGR02246 family)
MSPSTKLTHPAQRSLDFTNWTQALWMPELTNARAQSALVLGGAGIMDTNHDDFEPYSTLFHFRLILGRTSKRRNASPLYHACQTAAAVFFSRVIFYPEATMRQRAVLFLITPIFLGCVACLGCAPVVANRANSAADDAVTVRQLEERVAAATERNDADALAPYLASDFTFVNPAGRLVTKDQFLNNMRTGRLHNTAYKVDEMQVRIYGSAAVVTYRSTVAGTAGLQEIAPVRRRTTMLVKRDGRWTIVAQQSTPVLTLAPRN